MSLTINILLNETTLELTLSGSTNVASCNSTQFNDTICKNTYGRTAFQCGVGECRCSGNQSFPNSNRTRCCKLTI